MEQTEPLDSAYKNIQELPKNLTSKMVYYERRTSNWPLNVLLVPLSELLRVPCYDSITTSWHMFKSCERPNYFLHRCTYRHSFVKTFAKAHYTKFKNPCQNQCPCLIIK